MSWLRITKTGDQFPHMRSQITHNGNNKNTISKSRPNQEYLFVLLYRSNTNIREFLVIYVLN
jgi:hypothetical protein